mmetsp:Transcript_16772/g.48169  ORF Transcript_16772/g.48169 Transcript_16772/m.48169 type:complete len:209 (+) Transcript_16772:42-668(+)
MRRVAAMDLLLSPSLHDAPLEACGHPARRLFLTTTKDAAIATISPARAPMTPPTMPPTLLPESLVELSSENVISSASGSALTLPSVPPMQHLGCHQYSLRKCLTSGSLATGSFNRKSSACPQLYAVQTPPPESHCSSVVPSFESFMSNDPPWQECPALITGNRKAPSMSEHMPSSLLTMEPLHLMSCVGTPDRVKIPVGKLHSLSLSG